MAESKIATHFSWCHQHNCILSGTCSFSLSPLEQCNCLTFWLPRHTCIPEFPPTYPEQRQAGTDNQEKRLSSSMWLHLATYRIPLQGHPFVDSRVWAAKCSHKETGGPQPLSHSLDPKIKGNALPQEDSEWEMERKTKGGKKKESRARDSSEINAKSFRLMEEERDGEKEQHRTLSPLNIRRGALARTWPTGSQHHGALMIGFVLEEGVGRV